MTNNSLSIFINNEEILSDKTLKINIPFLNVGSAVLNNVYPKEWEDDKDYISRFYYPKNYANCEIYIDGELKFAGIVKNSGDIPLNPRHPKLASLQILDYKCLLSEGKDLNFVIDNKTVSEAIEMVINFVSDYGFKVGDINIVNDGLIMAYSTLNKSAFDVLQYLAEVSQSIWTARMVDKNEYAVDFYSPELMETTTDIEYTKEYFEKNEIVDMTFNFATRDYRNKQVILSNLVYGSIDYNENPYVNGYDTNFTTEQLIGVIKKIYVNGIEKTFAYTEYKDLGIIADFYYTPGENILTSSNILTTGTNLVIVYTPLIKGRETVYNNAEIGRIGNQIERNGTIERYESRNDILNSKELREIAETYIKFRGTADVNLKIKSQKDLFDVGQKVHFNFDGIPELAIDYLVKNEEIELIQTGNARTIFYSYELSNNFDTETAINFFDNQRRKMSGNIGESQFITRDIDINNNINIIFSDVEIEEVTTDTDNILNCLLNAPLTK